MPVASGEAESLGIMRVNDEGRVMGFLEKPKTRQELDLVRTAPSWIDARGIASHGRDCLANMGIYLFNRNTLADVLEKTDYRDFGKEVFPASIRARHVQVHLTDCYWEDIGTIRSFYRANLELASPNAPFDLASVEAPIYSHARFLPPARIAGAAIRDSLVADGSTIGSGAVIENSVIGLRCRIGRNAVIRNSILMGNDYYETPETHAANGGPSAPPLGVGEGAYIDGAIVDKNCRIGPWARVVNEQGVEETVETAHGMIRDGIVVLPKNTAIPARWTIPADAVSV